MSDERREEIMAAAYAALCDHGYADLTMQDIADESSLSKAALHYHFDTKRDLLFAFLEHLYEHYTERLSAAEAAATDDPTDRLKALVDAALFPPERDDTREFRTAMLEIKAQAPYEPAFRDRLADFDAVVHDRAVAILAEGIDRGHYDDALDPDDVASFLVTVITGARTRCVATGEPVTATQRAVYEFLSGLSDGHGTSRDVDDAGSDEEDEEEEAPPTR